MKPASGFSKSYGLLASPNLISTYFFMTSPAGSRPDPTPRSLQSLRSFRHPLTFRQTGAEKPLFLHFGHRFGNGNVYLLGKQTMIMDLRTIILIHS